MAGIKITGLGAYTGPGANEGTLLVMVDPTDPTMAPSGTTKQVTGAKVVGSYQGAAVNWPNASLVIGPDPGGLGRIRVGGGVNVSQDLSVGTSLSAGQGTFTNFVQAQDLTATRTGHFATAVVGSPDPGGTQLLRVAGDALVNGVLSAASLAVTGNETVNGTISATGLTVTGATSLTGPLTVQGLTTLQQLNITPGPVVIGADPGGAQLLRVGGTDSLRLGGTALLGNTTTFGADANGAVADWDGGAFWIRAKAGRALGLGGNNATLLTLSTQPAAIIGTDPGGGQLLRVGGDALFATNIAVGLGTGSSGRSVGVNAPAGSPAQILFSSASSVKWVMGRGVTDGSDLFQLYNSSLGQTALTVSNTTDLVTMTGQLNVTGPYGFAIGGLAGAPRIEFDTGTSQFSVVNASNSVTNFRAFNVTALGWVQLSMAQQLQWGGSTDAITVNPAGTMLFYTSNAVRLRLDNNGVTATQYNLTNGGILTSSSTYTVLRDPTNRDALLLGGTADPANYFYNSAHYFLNRAANATWMTIFAGGVVVNPDPGGSELFRVGGQIRSLTPMIIAGTNSATVNTVGATIADFSFGRGTDGFFRVMNQSNSAQPLRIDPSTSDMALGVGLSNILLNGRLYWLASGNGASIVGPSSNITIGAADSGGAGFRVLRIPNS